MNGKGLIVTVLGVGVSLGILTATLGGFILHGQAAMQRDVDTLQSDVGDLRERMARLEGRMDTLQSVIVQVFTKGDDR